MNNVTVPQRTFFQRIFLSPDERRLRSGWRILGQTILLLFFSLVFTTIYIGITKFFPLDELLDWLNIGLLNGQVVTFLAVTLSVILARRFFDRRTFTSLGLDWNATAFRDLFFGVFLAGLIMGLIYLVEWALGWLTFEGHALDDGNIYRVIISVVTMFVLFVIVAWQEELLSRGYWLQNLSAGLNLIWGVLLSSLFFALAHLANPNVSIMAVVGLVAGGIFLAYGYLRTLRLWLPIGLHIGWNFFEGTVLGFQVSGLSGMPRLIIQTVEGPELITGGAFGPEAGLIILPALLLGAVMINLYTRQRDLRGEGSVQ
jgi:membrane protease YdiL (CAAX protease family)